MLILFFNSNMMLARQVASGHFSQSSSKIEVMSYLHIELQKTFVNISNEDMRLPVLSREKPPSSVTQTHKGRVNTEYKKLSCLAGLADDHC